MASILANHLQMTCSVQYLWLSTKRLACGRMYVQEFGESLLGGMRSMSRALAARHDQGVTPEQARVDARERAVYFDVFGLFMVRDQHREGGDVVLTGSHHNWHSHTQPASQPGWVVVPQHS